MKISIGRLPAADKEFFERVNPGYICTGETLVKEWTRNGVKNSITLVVFRAASGTTHWTRHGMCRDCGDHYIIAGYSGYDKIDKGTLKVTRDVEDR